MPTIFTHAFVGVTAAAIYGRGEFDTKVLALATACSILPDFDVVGFAFRIPYGHFFGHRGFFHSIFFAGITALFASCFFLHLKRTKLIAIACFFFIVAVSHGILDTLTSGGLGIALLSPFDTERFLCGFTPFEAAPLTLGGFLTPWGLRVLKAEFLWIWLPSIVVISFLRVQKSMRSRECS